MMALVWECARCGTTDPGTDDQRDGRQPPSGWLNIYRPTSARDQRQDVLCGKCRIEFAAWLRKPLDGDDNGRDER